MRRFCVLAVALCTAGSTLLGQESGTDRITIELLLGRAGWYVLDFLDKFSNVVAEETYLQDSSVPMQSPALIGRPGATARNRRLKSDFLLVSVSTAQDWVPFRDVFEVDAQPVRDREQRLARLFLNPSLNSLQQANRIQDESARYNLGNMKRTVNNPVLGVVVLQADMQQRFKYSLGRIDPKVGPDVWVIEYQEDARPSIVRGRSDLDLFAHGRVWVEAETGRILKTEVLLDQPSLRARITSLFRYDERFEIAVPFEMQEEYKFDNGTRVTAIATYERFRRFDVSTDENIRSDEISPDAPVKD
ncbi:MAG TPA: hypothetical protein VM818_05950 [Vicinamibacterales bacterium]|nr:hypothetical protein [Vicinamibacterales bacterium]